MVKKTVYLAALVFFSIINWREMYLAQFDEYDENWGRLIVVFLMSFFTSLTLIVLAIKQKDWIKDEILGLTIFYLLGNSPITVFLVVMNYTFVFGVDLRN